MKSRSVPRKPAAKRQEAEPTPSPRQGTGLISPAAWRNCIYCLDKRDFRQESAPGEKSPGLSNLGGWGSGSDPAGHGQVSYNPPHTVPLTGHLARTEHDRTSPQAICTQAALSALRLGVAAQFRDSAGLPFLLKNKVKTTFGWSGPPEPRERDTHTLRRLEGLEMGLAVLPGELSRGQATLPSRAQQTAPGKYLLSDRSHER